MRIVFFGSSRYVVPVVERLYNNFDLPLVVTTEQDKRDAIPFYCLTKKIEYLSVRKSADLISNYQIEGAIASIGVGGKGSSDSNDAARFGDMVAICDVDESVLNARVDEIEKAGKKRPAAFTDLRKLLEDKTIDAISIATPNHQHTLQTVWACQAGKDVYVEKPCTHNIFEARQIVAAARKYDRMVQQGSQSRSSEALQEGVQKMREGLIGDVYMARGLCYKTRNTIGRTPVSDVPEGVDYDLWTGPAPKRPFTKNRFHYNWHWFWDTGDGDIGNQGIHEMDKARWGLGVKYPIKASAIGGKVMFDDDQETPNVLNASFEFNENGKTKILEFEVRHWITNREYMVPVTGGGAGAGGALSIAKFMFFTSWVISSS